MNEDFEKVVTEIMFINKKMQSSLGSINWRDVVKGLFMAVLVPVFGYVEQVVSSGNFVFDVPTLEKLAVAGFVAYLGKQFMSDSNGNPLGIGSPKS